MSKLVHVEFYNEEEYHNMNITIIREGLRFILFLIFLRKKQGSIKNIP